MIPKPLKPPANPELNSALFQKYVIPNLRELRYYAQSLAKQPHFVDEVINLFLTRAYRFIHKCDFEKNYMGWLVRMLRFCWIDRVREARGRGGNRPLHVPIEYVADTLDDGGVFVERLAETMAIDETIGRLDERTQEIISLKRQGYINREIGDVLGVTESRVSQILVAMKK